MKRDAYGDDGPNQKRQRQIDDEVTFLIPSKVAGSIIGKGGANISKLRNQWRRCGGYSVCWLPVPPSDAAARIRHATQYKASITVPDCPGPERVLSISADDVDTVLDIVKDVLPCLAEHAGIPNKGDEEDLDVRLLIHQSRAGCVIGKGGAKIKELREKTGARLKIFSNPAPQSTERVVQLYGVADCVAAAVREVLDLVRQVPIKGGVQPYDPHNYDDYYAEEYGGFGIGQGGCGMRGGARGGRSPGAGGRGGARGPPRPGPPPRGGPPRAPFGGEFSGQGPRFGGAPRGGFGGGYGGGFGRAGGAPPPAPPFAHNGQPSHHQDTTTQVTIPKDLAGAIIGKAGSRIRKIRQESGAGIEIAEPLAGSSDRVITISGTPQRIQMAQYLLQQSVHESNPSLGGGGGRSNF